MPSAEDADLLEQNGHQDLMKTALGLPGHKKYRKAYGFLAMSVI